MLFKHLPMPAYKKPVSDDTSYNDFIQPFLIDHSAIRGRLVRLNEALDNILTAHNYPMLVSLHLAEQIVLAALLSATLSGDGILTVQVKGDGPVRFMVVDVMAAGVIRGYAQVDEKALKKAAKNVESLSLSQTVGKGYLAITLDEGKNAQRYQGIVELEGNTLSDAFRGYFLQSQQAEMRVHVTVQPPGDVNKKWTGGGIIIERIPTEGGKDVEFTREEQDELWKRSALFMRTLKDSELLDKRVTPQNLLYRLFNEDGVWVYKLQAVRSGCRCSRVRVRGVLKTLPEEELLAALTDDKLTIHCQFCNKREVFTRIQIKRLYEKKAKKRTNN
jgi:molecular chaperone Hsp33